jgi:hypothetical protein
MQPEYSFEKKKKLASKISFMRDKTALRKIRDIIFTANPTIKARKDKSGYLMYFQNYTNDTYEALDTYITQLETLKMEQFAKDLHATNPHIATHDHEITIQSDTSDHTHSPSRRSDPALHIDAHDDRAYRVNPTNGHSTTGVHSYSNHERRLMKRSYYERMITQNRDETINMHAHKTASDDYPVMPSNPLDIIDQPPKAKGKKPKQTKQPRAPIFAKTRD